MLVPLDVVKSSLIFIFYFYSLSIYSSILSPYLTGPEVLRSMVLLPLKYVLLFLQSSEIQLSNI